MLHAKETVASMKRSGRTIVSLAVILLALLFAGVQADAAGVPDLTISKSHNGNFTRGRSGASYTLTVTNIGSAATTQTVTVTDTLPVGLTATDISGTGWSCTLLTLTCTRNDALGVFPSVVPVHRSHYHVRQCFRAPIR